MVEVGLVISTCFLNPRVKSGFSLNQTLMFSSVFAQILHPFLCKHHVILFHRSGSNFIGNYNNLDKFAAWSYNYVP